MDQRTCAIATCDRRHAARGWCQEHWRRWRAHGDPEAGGKPRSQQPRVCVFDECDRKPQAQSLCARHLSNLYRWGDPAPRERSIAECKAEDCTKQAAQLGLCHRHYLRLRSNGSPEVVRRRVWAEPQLTLDGKQVCVSCITPKAPDQFKAPRRQCRDCLAREARERRARARSIEVEMRDRPSEFLQESLTRQVPGSVTPDADISRSALRAKDGDSCQYCMTPLNFTSTGRNPRPDQATIEHVVPFALGGAHVWTNVVLACRRCNSSKRAQALSTWLARQGMPDVERRINELLERRVSATR